VDLHGGPGNHRFVKIRELPVPDALDVVRLLRAAAPGTSFAVERSGGLHHEPTYPPLHLDPGESVAPAEKLLAADFEGSAVADQPVLKVLAFHPELGPDEFLALARTAVGDRAAITRSSPSALLEISGRGVSKASTLELCCAERGVSPAEVVAFGDMPNDMEMLAWAGTSYAMGNAHPDLLAAATGVTATNNEDGVARVIESILAAR
jgi:hydroxymethylpyrimidine pyrophosphatase-like HAD family hydrolase